LLNHAVFTEAEYNKGNSYLRLGVRLNYFGKFDKLLIEPRINIRQVSKQFALKLEEFKNQTTTQIIDFEDDFLGVEKDVGCLSTMKIFLLQPASKALLG
jgi:hypothetical protein